MISEEKVNECVISLINMAKDTCWNNFSQRNEFIISEIHQNVSDFATLRRSRKRENSKKIPRSLTDTIDYLNKECDGIYLIECYIYYAEKTRTIIEIQYLLKTSLEDAAYRDLVKDKSPMIHSKVPMPPYYNEDKAKFDVNWELNPYIHQWKMFWWKRKAKQELSNPLIPRR